MNSPSREDLLAPAPIRPAPDRMSALLPCGFGLTMDPTTKKLQLGGVLMGGSPLRILRLSPRAAVLAAEWDAGATVGRRRSEQLLARRLVSSGIFVPRPAAPTLRPDDVTVVVPVRDRPEQLERLLASLQGLACIVVDDASPDAARTEDLAHAAHATFIGLATNAGPSAARNAGLAAAATPLVAFIDSDCVPEEGWLTSLLGHFDDPLVGAVAPRVLPLAVSPPTWLTRYEATRSSLDRGAGEGLVRPLSRIPYVPSAAVVVRRDIVSDRLFDPGLRGGEDVDLVWRMVEAGWDVRYVPSCTVRHEGPQTLAAWLHRRAFYGTTAAPLSRRHPTSLSPLNTSVWTAAVWGLAASRRPLLAAGALGASTAVLARRLNGLVDDPWKVAARIAGGGTAKSALPSLAGLLRAWAPLCGVGLLFRRTRRASALALLAPALNDWITDPGELDLAQFAALHVADDLAYASGVWRGCLRARTIRPLLPRISLRARVWSTRSLRTSLGADQGATMTDHHE